MAYKAWFIEKTIWYVEMPDAATPQEAEDMIYDGDEKAWDFRDFVSSEITVTHLEEM